MGQKLSLLFHDIVDANSEKTLSSDIIRFPFRTLTFRIKFTTNNPMMTRIKLFLSGDPTCPTTGEPTGTNLFAGYGATTYITGHNETVYLDHEIEIPERNTYIKMYALNNDTLEQDMLAIITIERID